MGNRYLCSLSCALLTTFMGLCCVYRYWCMTMDYLKDWMILSLWLMLFNMDGVTIVFLLVYLRRMHAFII